MNILNLIERFIFKLNRIFLKKKIDFYYYDEVDQYNDFNDYTKNYYEGLKVTNSTEISSFSKKMRSIQIQYLLSSVNNIPGIVLEIGAAKGMNVFCMSKITQKKIFVFDSFEGNDNYSENDNKLHDYYKNSDENYKIILKLFENNDKVKIFKGYIDKTLEKTLLDINEKISFCNISLDFEYASKLALESVYQKLNKNGIIYIQDYNFESYKSVKKVVDEFCLKNNVFLIKNYFGGGFIIKS